MRILSNGQSIFNNTNNNTLDVFSVYTLGITTNLGTNAISGYGLTKNCLTGIFGQSNSNTGFGVRCMNTSLDSAGTGIIGIGNYNSEYSGVMYLTYGSGGSFW